MLRVRSSASVVEVGVVRRRVVDLRYRHIDLRAAVGSRNLTGEVVVEGPNAVSFCVEMTECCVKSYSIWLSILLRRRTAVSVAWLWRRRTTVAAVSLWWTFVVSELFRGDHHTRLTRILEEALDSLRCTPAPDSMTWYLCLLR